MNFRLHRTNAVSCAKEINISASGEGSNAISVRSSEVSTFLTTALEYVKMSVGRIVLKAESTYFWDVTPCSLVVVYRLLEEITNP
jgi:hypothetical protein